MEILKNLLDKDESIFWIREIKKNLIPNQMKFEKEKKREMIMYLLISTIFISYVVFSVLFFFESFLFNIIQIIFRLFLFCIFLIFVISIFKKNSIFRLLRARSDYKKRTRIYETLRNYYSDDDLRNYPVIEAITKKHFIHFNPFNEDYPLLFGNDISHVYEFRNEFRFLNIKRLNDISTYVNLKKERYDLGLSFDLPEYDLYGDDAPNYWFQNLSEKEYQDILKVFSEVAPQAKITDLSRIKKNKIASRLDFENKRFRRNIKYSI